jgi:ABC-type antimicrobial peptide transport system permease subunit
MNKFFFSVLFILFIISAHSQTVSVFKEREKVKGESIEVYSISLDGKKDEISSAWNKFLKDIGKLKQSANPMTVSEPVISGTTYSSNVFYADLKKNNEGSSTVWAGINPAEWNEAERDRVNRELDKLVYQFGVSFYRQKVQVQIDETQQALDAVEKQTQRAINQNKDLTLKLSNNDREKIQLEKSLETNKLENAALKIKLENNKRAQDSLANVSVQIIKVMESHKEKQRKIN